VNLIHSAFFIILFFLPRPQAAGSQNDMHNGGTRERSSYYLLKPRIDGRPGYSGERQHSKAGGMAAPLRAGVVNQKSEPVIGMPVIFEVVAYPSGGENYQLDRRLVTTDSSGMAAVNFRTGSAEGEYRVMARIRSAGEENMQLYTVYARGQNWHLLFSARVAGGLALFLFGLGIMSKGMLRLAGDRIRGMPGSLTGNRIQALVPGAFITMVIQSSSAVYVMLADLVNSGMMRFRVTPGVILGAAIGTTVTAQVIAFRLTDFSLLFVAFGFVLRGLSGKEQFRHTGNIILGFGLLFFGMDIISEALQPMRSYEPFLQMLGRLENPLVAILAGAVLTALIRSSAAFAGILVILGTQGLLSLGSSIPLLLGASIGTAVTSVLAVSRSGTEARKVAAAVMVFSILGVLVFVWLISPFAAFITEISPPGTPGPDEMARLAEVLPRQIANAHTLYNVFAAMLLLPFTALIAGVIDRLMPKAKPGEGSQLRSPS
jgi:Na/Pi-cotransporter